MTNWLVAFLGRDRTYDITNARNDLDYRSVVPFEVGLDGMRASTTHT